MTNPCVNHTLIIPSQAAININEMKQHLLNTTSNQLQNRMPSGLAKQRRNNSFMLQN